MRSEARARLAQLTEERGTDGVLRLEPFEGADLPPGSTDFPPCRCPRHRAGSEPASCEDELSAKVRAVDERSQGGRT